MEKIFPPFRSPSIFSPLLLSFPSRRGQDCAPGSMGLVLWNTGYDSVLIGKDVGRHKRHRTPYAPCRLLPPQAGRPFWALQSNTAPAGSLISIPAPHRHAIHAPAPFGMPILMSGNCGTTIPTIIFLHVFIQNCLALFSFFSTCSLLLNRCMRATSESRRGHNKWRRSSTARPATRILAVGRFEVKLTNLPRFQATTQLPSGSQTCP